LAVRIALVILGRHPRQKKSSQGYVSDGLALYKGHEIESDPDAIAGLRELEEEEKEEGWLERKAMRLIAEAATRRKRE
jgi:hypothetical protein